MKNIKLTIAYLFFIFSCHAIANIYSFPTDVSYYFASSNEGKFSTNTNFTKLQNILDIPLTLGEWNGKNIQTQDHVSLHREYTSSKSRESLFFLAINAKSEDKFHAAEVCYLGEDWNISKRSVLKFDKENVEFSVKSFVAEKDGYKRVVLYWYFWPDSKRLNHNGFSMFRIAVDVDDSEEVAIESAIGFIHKLMKIQLETNISKNNIPYKRNKTTKLKISGMFEKSMSSAYQWIKSHMTPNSTVPNPVGPRRNLVLSYDINKDNPSYKYIFSKSALYDNALAVISFVMLRDFENAQKIIEAVQRTQSKDKRLWFSFNTHNMWPNDKDNEGAVTRSGASAWFGYSVVYYLIHKSLEDMNYLKYSQEAKSNLEFAKDIANAILTREIKNPKDNRNYFITGGEGSYRLKLNSKTKEVEEVFNRESVTWASVEHNIDAFYFFRDLGLLSGNRLYVNKSKSIKTSLLNKSWNTKIKQFNRGQRAEGSDTVEALDAASWGAIFLSSIGEVEKAMTALDKTKSYSISKKISHGFKPYLNLLIYEDKFINKLIYPNNPSYNWNDSNLLWYEGSFGVVLAYCKLQKKKLAKEILKKLSKDQLKTGGFSYANEEVKFQFSNSASVASTAWFIMSAQALSNPVVNRTFWANDSEWKSGILKKLKQLKDDRP